MPQIGTIRLADIDSGSGNYGMHQTMDQHPWPHVCGWLPITAPLGTWLPHSDNPTFRELAPHYLQAGTDVGAAVKVFIVELKLSPGAILNWQSRSGSGESALGSLGIFTLRIQVGNCSFVA